MEPQQKTAIKIPTIRPLLGTFALLVFLDLYLLIHLWMGDWYWAHFLFVGAILFFYFVNQKTRIFVILALPLILQMILYDLFRYIPFEWLKPIKVSQPYLLDQWLFGLSTDSGILLFHEYFRQFQNRFLDLFSGIFYHLLDPLQFISLLLLWILGSRNLAQRFGSAFLLMNLFAFATYFFYPAAAPWYVEQFGFLPPESPVMGNAAGLVAFDQMLGVAVSTNAYSHNPVVFGAIPSMHAGFSMLCWIYSFYLNRIWAVLMGIFFFGTMFAALYLQHHYAIDLVIGVIYALIAFLLTDFVFRGRIQKTYQNIFSISMPRN